MKIKFSQILFAIIFSAAALLPAAFAHAANCDSFTQMFNINTANVTGNNVNTTNPASQVKVFCSAGYILTYVLNLLFEFTGAVAVIFIILGGFWFVTSAGNE